MFRPADLQEFAALLEQDLEEQSGWGVQATLGVVVGHQIAPVLPRLWLPDGAQPASALPLLSARDLVKFARATGPVADGPVQLVFLACEAWKTLGTLTSGQHALALAGITPASVHPERVETRIVWAASPDGTVAYASRVRGASQAEAGVDAPGARQSPTPAALAALARATRSLW
ncbi:hypothetical protein [Acrocarpospora catenulata]|uniref:hypothetical protein n=1 Tax=Acrocarpospora catenulata TaxID=2836182 RepID=UPI001BDB0FF1|nr:hypothetical protein [Acrocarpospora catenulata]